MAEGPLTTPEPGAKKWSLESLKEYLERAINEARAYFERVIDERDRQHQADLAAAEKAVAAAMEALTRAGEKADRNDEKWRDASNKWREAMDDREAHFVPRSEFASGFADLSRQIGDLKEWKDRQAGQVASGVTTRDIIAILVVALGVVVAAIIGFT